MTPTRQGLIAAVAIAVTCTATAVAADENEGVARTNAPATSSDYVGVPVCLYDNGDTNGMDGYSNRVEPPGGRRTLLDDFTVPDGETWRLTDFHHIHLWDQAAPGAGTGMEIVLRADAAGTPGDVMQALAVTDYVEGPTGRNFFTRPEAESWTSFEPVDLGPGTYWFEAVVVGPENNFWLSADQQGNECWANYEDGGGLRPSSDAFPNGASDISWCIAAEVLGACPEDLDESGAVDFGDVLSILAGWGPCPDPCPPSCAPDLDKDCNVAFSDILAILAAWGPCTPE